MVIEAHITSRGNSGPVEEALKPYIRNLPEKRWEFRFAGVLELAIGCEYLYTNNTDVEHGLANGARSVLHDIVLRENATVRFVQLNGAGGGVHVVSAEDVVALVLKHKGKNYVSKDVYSDLGPGYFPVGTETAPKMVSFKNRGTFKVHIKQFPLIVGTVTTGHKLQGDTVDALHVADYGRRGYRVNKDGWLYVMLSRVKTLEGLYLSTPLETDPQKFRPRVELQAEMTRLRAIDALCTQRVSELMFF